MEQIPMTWSRNKIGNERLPNLSMNWQPECINRRGRSKKGGAVTSGRNWERYDLREKR